MTPHTAAEPEIAEWETRPGCTQKERVLQILKVHGKHGVRSDHFLNVHIPRAAGRIHELKEEGYEISSEREKQFCRYTLVGTGAGVGRVAHHSVSPDSGENAEGHMGGSEVARVYPKPSEPSASPRLFDLPAPKRTHDFIEDEWAA